jgi:hypothetical protein
VLDTFRRAAEFGVAGSGSPTMAEGLTLLFTPAFFEE